jgi:hypothetical protein
MQKVPTSRFGGDRDAGTSSEDYFLTLTAFVFCVTVL